MADSSDWKIDVATEVMTGPGDKPVTNISDGGNGDDAVTRGYVDGQLAVLQSSVNAAQGVIPAITVAATSYPITQPDAGRRLIFTANSPITVTLPDDGDPVATGSIVFIVQAGTGQITFVNGAGATLNIPHDNEPRSRTQYSTITIYKDGPNLWGLAGDLFQIATLAVYTVSLQAYGVNESLNISELTVGDRAPGSIVNREVVIAEPGYYFVSLNLMVNQSAADVDFNQIVDMERDTSRRQRFRGRRSTGGTAFEIIPVIGWTTVKLDAGQTLRFYPNNGAAMTPVVGAIDNTITLVKVAPFGA